MPTDRPDDREAYRQALDALARLNPALAAGLPAPDQCAPAPGPARPPKRATRRGGSIFTRPGSRFLWIKWYDANGRPHRESTRTAAETEARRLLNERLGSVAKGEPIAVHAGRLRVGVLLDDLTHAYTANGQATKAITSNVARLRAAFGRVRAVDLTTPMLRAYIARHQCTEDHPDGLANSTLNRDLSALRRAYTLARQDTPPKLLYRPHFPLLKEGPARSGFFEREQFEAVRAHLPEDLRPVVTFAYITGWRVPSEVLPLTWPRVSFEDGAVRLDPGTTKNDEARSFPFTDELRALLVAQRETTAACQRWRGRIIPWVFHRAGQPIKDFRDAWHHACDAAGVPGRIPHDFRRTAIRNMVRAGIPERVAMVLSGHKTRHVFERYNITSAADLTEAAAKLNRAASRATGTLTGTVERIGVERRGERRG